MTATLRKRSLEATTGGPATPGDAMSTPDGTTAPAPMRIELLPAGHGDCILIEYGPPDAPRRILVDGGPARSYPALSARLARIPPEARRVDLLVITHVDADHIEGVVRLLNDAGLAVEIGEVWFNGYQHLPPDDLLGPAQGELVSALLRARGLAWNASFGGGPVRREPDGPLPRRELPGGLALTVLAPADADLRALRKVWERECRRAGITPGSTGAPPPIPRRLTPLDTYLGDLDVAALAALPQTETDTSPANASSIVLLAEYGGHRVLLAGDSAPGTLAAGIERLLAERGRDVLALDVFKLPHHGSRYNVTREVLDLVRARIFAVSTDGRYFGHPDAAAIARMLVGGPAGGRIVCNYRDTGTAAWSEPSVLDKYGFVAEFPQPGAEGAAVML